MSDRSRSGKARKGSRPVTAREREAARRRQQDQEREAARRRRRGRWIGTSISLAALLLVAGLEILLHRPTAEERSLLEMAPKLAAQAGCGPVRTIRPFPDGHDRTHIGSSGIRVMPPLSAYPSHPPVSGPHYPVPLDAGVYASPPPLDRAIHSLEHAAVIIWYDP